MAGPAPAAHENWSSRLAFMFAAIGSAVGLGNIWKFPYEAGEGGGGAFVLIYLAFVFGIGVPVMIAELSLGRRGKMSPPNAVRSVAKQEGRSNLWSIAGWSGVIGAFLVLSFYSVIAGLTLSYMVDSFSGSIDTLDASNSADYFGSITGNFPLLLLWHAIFMGLTIAVVARGIHGGLEKAVTWLMPALFAILILLVTYAMAVGDAASTFKFLFQPDFSKVTLETVIQALGQAFFSLSLALGSIMAYGAYVPRDVSLPKSAFIIAGADTAVAILAGLAIFPIVFQYGLEPGAGPGLVFITLPVAFAQMPGGILVGGAFFLLLAIAALTSAISLLEPIVAWLEEHRGINRVKSAIGGGIAIFILGIGSVLSFNYWADVTFLRGTVLDNLDFLTNNIIMPLGGLLVAVFVGWRMKRISIRDELAPKSEFGFALWLFMLRYVCPLALGLIFLGFAFRGLLFGEG
ncbi:sodium-dependent transporter [Iodidimonas gelatinilytica]|uniref:Sodium-dependent transporter n=1 Tax=Iodidimonas gelatinilytica TaxID=1236966 RepID=A0A5A7MQV1_9PROT|nr:sodium-dependent transporter [Iodidimonas gelatinilytica]GEQ97335.1 sodium-dependent transporter [Iodidimonas gelatinilytica]